MPNTNSKPKKAKKAVRIRTKRTITRGGSGLARTALERVTAMVLRDPCNGPLVHIHSGETGNIVRLAQDITINTTAGFTSGYVAFWPGTNGYLTGGNASSSVAFSPANFPGPGATMLSTTARKARCNAACIQVLPSSVAMTNMTGEIATGIVSADTISTLSSFSVDQIFQLLTRRETMAKVQFEQVWKPNLADVTYSSAASANDGTFVYNNPEDSNMVVIAFRGYPAGSGLSFRLTNVLEYTARAGTGMAASQATNNVPYDNALTTAAKLDATQPGWVYHVGKLAEAAAHGVSELASGWAMKKLMPAMAGLML